MTKKSVQFFRELYEPVLLKAGNKRVARSIQNRAASVKGAGFPHMDPDKQREASLKGGAARRLTLTPEVRSYLAALMTDARRRLPPEIRQRSAGIAGKARWAKKTPEERKAYSEYLVMKRRGKKMGDWTAVWPFPIGEA